MTSALDHRYPAIQGEEEERLENEFETFATDQGPKAAFEFETEAEAELTAEGELEDEFEAEREEELEGFVNPVRRIYRDAELMARLATKASEAESESEAEAFIGATVPLLAQLVPSASAIIASNGPGLIRGAARLVRTLRQDPNTRRLVRAVPIILTRTAQSLADRNREDTLEPGDVLDTLGTMANRVLSGPDRRRSLRAVKVFDDRFRSRARWQRNSLSGPANRRSRGRAR
ncbi:hypothetical protein [Rhodococcoides yunnanense]|uniref:hypothetical protein n=1 Tax=Rhodococcoides yunnanense TaxID=278209 RepID=UPI000932D11C|nr:hypothetical protein [Rhodococcus yunnanensis]